MGEIFSGPVHLAMDLFDMLLILSLPIILYSGRRKILKGDLYAEFSWLLYSSVFLLIYKAIEEGLEWIASYLPLMVIEFFEIIEFVAFILFIASFFIASLKAYSLAKAYGFADLKPPKKKGRK